MCIIIAAYVVMISVWQMTSIITPFKEEELRDKIEQMKKELENHGPGENGRDYRISTRD